MKIQTQSLPVRLVIYLLGIFALLVFLKIASPILVPLATGAFLALVLYPLVKLMERNKFPRVLAILLAMLLVLILLTGLILLVSSQFVGFSKDLPSISQGFMKTLDDSLEWFQGKIPISSGDLVGIVNDSLASVLSSGTSFVSGTVSAATEAMTFMVLVPIYVFLFLLYRSHFKRFLFALFPSQEKEEVAGVVKRSQEVIKNYVSGIAIVMVIVGVLNSVGLMVLGIDYALFFGVLAALLTVIPYFGVVMGAIPPFVVALVTKDSIWYPIGVLAVFGFVQFLEGNFITPNVVGNKVSLNPLTAIVALIVGNFLWGTAGLILFIPMVAVLKVILDSIEPLRPFGLLLGTREAREQNKKPPFWKRWLAKVKKSD